MSKEMETRSDDLYVTVSYCGGGGGGGGGGADDTAHNVCVAGYAGVGGLVGGIATSETFGWGAVPGGMIGTAVGTAVCDR